MCRSFVQYYCMFWAVYISHHQVGIGAQTNKKGRGLIGEIKFRTLINNKSHLNYVYLILRVADK